MKRLSISLPFAALLIFVACNEKTDPSWVRQDQQRQEYDPAWVKPIDQRPQYQKAEEAEEIREASGLHGLQH